MYVPSSLSRTRSVKCWGTFIIFPAVARIVFGVRLQSGKKKFAGAGRGVQRRNTKNPCWLVINAITHCWDELGAFLLLLFSGCRTRIENRGGKKNTENSGKRTKRGRRRRGRKRFALIAASRVRAAGVLLVPAGDSGRRRLL